MNIKLRQSLRKILVITVLIGAINSLANAESRPMTFISEGQDLEKNKNYVKSYELYKKAYEYAETQEVALLGMSRSAIQTGDTKEVHEFLHKYTRETNPFNVEMHLAYIELLRKEGLLKEALAEVQIVETLRPGFMPTKEQAAHIYFELKQDEDALKLYHLVLKNNPNMLLSRVRRAQTSMRLKDYQNAIEDLQYILSEKPGNAEVTQLLGEAYFKAGKYDKSEEVYKKAIKLSSASVEILEKLADIQVKLNRTNDAIQFYKKCIMLEPTRFEIGNKLASLYLKNEMSKDAEDEYKRQLALQPDNSGAAENLIALWTDQKKLDLVGGLLKNFIQKFPQQTWAVLRYSKLLLAIGNDQVAEKILKAHIDVQEKNLETKLLLSYVQSKNGKKDDAIDVLRDAEKLYPNESKIKFNLALLYEETNRLNKAIDKYSEIKGESSVANKAKINLAFIFDKKGEKASALELLRSVVGDEKKSDVVLRKINALENELQSSGRSIASEKSNEQ